jgi:hypothetical protein
VTLRREPSLKTLSAAFAVVLALAACSDQGAAPEPAPEPAPAPAPGPEPEPPVVDPLDALDPEVRATRDALLAAARTSDWDAIGASIPTETMFTSNFGGDEDHVAFYRGLATGTPATDIPAVIVELLEGPFAQVGEVTVWPDLHARVPFEIDDEERGALEEVYGAEDVRGWIEVGAYLGWRIGITADGEWIFLVAGD